MTRQWAIVLMAVSVAFILSLFPLCGQAQTDDEQYKVFCYVGNPQKGDEVYSFNTFRPLQATQLCNATYIGCHGKCIGCYLKKGEEICAGPSGGQFKK
jgi:hypothetical protein